MIMKELQDLFKESFIHNIEFQESLDNMVSMDLASAKSDTTAYLKVSKDINGLVVEEFKRISNDL